jgi:hypothetical protein
MNEIVEVRKILRNQELDNECLTANGLLYCYCGKCEPEDYKLPEDLI